MATPLSAPVTSARAWRALAVTTLLGTMIAASGAATSPDVENIPPELLKVGDTSFNVRVEKVPDSYVGMTYFERRLIRIDPGSEAGLRRKIYLHEMLHVAWHEGRLPLNKTRKYTEEEAIQQLVPGLLEVLSQNPQALDYLSQANHPHTTDSIASK